MFSRILVKLTILTRMSLFVRISVISTRLYTSAHMVDYNFRQSAPPHERKVVQTRPVFDL